MPRLRTLSRDEIRLINKRATLLARQAAALYVAHLHDAALQAIGQGQQVTDDWLALQVPAIDGDMLPDVAVDDWHDVEPF